MANPDLCEKCHAPRVITTLKTYYGQYYRCEACGHARYAERVIDEVKPERSGSGPDPALAKSPYRHA